MSYKVYQVRFRFSGMDGLHTQNIEVKQGADLVKEIQKKNGTKRKIELVQSSVISEVWI